MKLSKIKLGGMALALTLSLGMPLTSCSDKSLPGDDENPQNVEKKGDGALRFVIKNAWDHRTRALDDSSPDMFEDGKGDEGKVENVLMVFFRNGNFFSAAEPTLYEGSPVGDHTDESMYEGVVSIKGPTGQKPTHVLCIINGKDIPLNYDGNHKDFILNEVTVTRLRLSQVQLINAIENFAVELNEAGDGPSKPLLMSNSVYLDREEAEEEDGKETVTIHNVQPIPEECFVYPEDGEDVTTAPPVHIDVERVHARVEITNNLEGHITPTDISINLSEEKKVMKVTPVIKGITLGQLVNKSYLVKSLEGHDKFNVVDWESEMNFPRSYWATSPEMTPWNKKDKNGFLDNNSDYHYFTYNEMEGKKFLLHYPMENTTEFPTCIIITAQLVDEDGKPLEDIVDMSSTRKYFYTMEDYKKQVAKELQKKSVTFQHKDEDGNTVQDEDWAPYVQLKRTDDKEDKAFHVMPYVVPDGTKLTNYYAEKANSVLKDFDPVMCYKDGMCYYYVEIEHDVKYAAAEDGTPGDNTFAMIRNHAYKVTLKSLKGIGSPIYDPDQIIIPDRPDDIIELNAEVHALQWRIVNQVADIK